MYQKIFPAELDQLYVMLAFIKEYGKSHNLSPSTLEQIVLAAEEALVNVISYGYPPEKKGTIEISCEEPTPKAGIKIMIKDQGVPFNPVEKVPTALPTPSSVLSKPDNSLGGYGIYILIGLMDRVEYQRIDGGNILSLTKYTEGDQP
jgi:anti-sigma regulatory factor (Ser/Thr protein kinase)